jgi:hypothetical protein
MNSTDKRECMVPSSPASSGVASTIAENKEQVGAPKNGKDPAPKKTGKLKTI